MSHGATHANSITSSHPHDNHYQQDLLKKAQEIPQPVGAKHRRVQFAPDTRYAPGTDGADGARCGGQDLADRTSELSPLEPREQLARANCSWPPLGCSALRNKILEKVVFWIAIGSKVVIMMKPHH